MDRALRSERSEGATSTARPAPLNSSGWMLSYDRSSAQRCPDRRGRPDKLGYTRVVEIGHPNVACRIDRDATRPVESRIRVARRTRDRRSGGSFGGARQNRYACAVEVCYPNVASPVHSDR